VQFTQGLRVELRHCLSPSWRAVWVLARCNRAVSLPPDRRLGPAELAEFIRAQRPLGDREELVQLRQRHRSAAQHCVCLATVMDLVLEQVAEKATRTLRLVASASVYVNDRIDAS